MTDTAPETGAYLDVFDHAASDEPERLTALGDALNQGTFRRLDRLVPRPDARCLDIGSGTGAIARHLAALCPHGEVVATDLDVRNLQVPDSVHLLRHDVTTDDFPHGAFDLIVARWVFSHLPDRRDVLRRVRDWLAPGGCLLLEDPADFAMLCSPNALVRHIAAAVKQTLARLAGTDTEWSHAFPLPLDDLGLERTELAVDASIVGPDSPMSRFLDSSVQRVTAPLLASGRVTERELARWREQLHAPQNRGLGLVNMAAWGYRPPVPNWAGTVRGHTS